MRKQMNGERLVKNRPAKENIRRKKEIRKEGIEVSRPNLSSFKNRIITGDCEKILRNIPSCSVDIMLTSPPYNFGLDYGSDDDTAKWDHYFSKLAGIWAECKRILIPGGRFIVNVQPLFSDYIPTHHLISKQLLDLGLLWKGEILWEKNNYNCKFTAWGSWKSPSMPYLKYSWEFVEIFCKETHKKSGTRDRIDITGDEFKNWVYARWAISPEKGVKRYNHPAMFPEELVERLLKLFSYRGDVILDPFSGAGTTAVVAERLFRDYIAIEISEEYNAIARERLRAHS